MATDICVRVGRRIRLLRGQRGLTQTVLADRAEITREHLSELENGRKEVGLRTLSRIADAMDVGLHDFFFEIDAHHGVRPSKIRHPDRGRAK